MKKTLLLGSILASALAFAPSAVAAQGIGGCQLDGTANFATPLTATSITGSYDFSGTLSNCQGTYSDSGGTVSAGQNITVNGVAYQPIDKPTLTGGCTNSTTSGTAFVDWGGGKYSVIGYSTTGAAAAVALTGTFKSTVTLTSVAADPITGLHSTLTLSNLAYGGDSAGGALAFEPASPLDCQTGVKSAGIQGVIGHGNNQ